MHAFDGGGKLVHLTSAEQVIELFLPVRLSMYERRKAHLLDSLRREWQLLASQARFVRLFSAGEIEIARQSRAQISEQLARLGFDPFEPAAVQTGSAPPADAEALSVGREHPPAAGLRDGRSPFEYLLRMPLLSLTEERVASLERRCAEAVQKAEALSATSAENLYRQELIDLRPELEAHYEAARSKDGASRVSPPPTRQAKGAQGAKTRNSSTKVERARRTTSPRLKKGGTPGSDA